jgi:hypothetical protein
LVPEQLRLSEDSFGESKRWTFLFYAGRRKQITNILDVWTLKEEQRAEVHNGV